MNAVDEASVREQLQRAVSVIDPAPPQLDMLRSRAVRRTRTKRVAGGVMVLAVAGAAAAIVATIVSVAPGGNSRVQIASAPTHQSLVRFAKAHGGLKVTGPFAAKPGWYGAFTTKRAIVVATYTGQQWHQDGAAVTSLGAGKFVSRLGEGPQLAGATTPSIYVRVVGADVSYFGSVLRRSGSRWRTARFGTCGHNKLCYPGNSEPYGHPVGHGFVSIANDCTPNCAAGTNYRVTWQWRAAQAKFVATAERVVKN
jgi:hypothetical protein